uniref:Uncharacterized protein n=1 Tax=Arundo donax TaxID=35708 RepID=A0A0A8YFX8_ARUDO
MFKTLGEREITNLYPESCI